MNRTNNLEVFRRFLKTNVPQDRSGSVRNLNTVTAYVQDSLHSYDYYILFWNPDYDEFFALVDPLPDKDTLDLEAVPLSFLEGSTLYYKRIPLRKQVHWQFISLNLYPIKNGTPGFRNI